MKTLANNCLILLVEDNADLRESTQLLLQLKGYRVMGVENATDALRLLSRMEPLPCLILLDLVMPEMDGWQLLQELQRNAVFANISVVILSAINNDYTNTPNVVSRLVKPVREEQVASILEQICSAKKCAYFHGDHCWRTGLGSDALCRPVYSRSPIETQQDA